MKTKIKHAVAFFAILFCILASSLAQFTYTNNNPSLTILPYGVTFTYSVTWSGGGDDGVDLLYMDIPGKQISYNATYPSSYTFAYTIDGIAAENDGTYYIAFINYGSGGQQETLPITLHVAPAILTEPQNTVCISGSSTTMGIAGGPNTATFQWFNAATGDSISGAGNSPVLVPTVANNGERVYCQISNSYGSVSSASAVLSVGTAPSISSQTSTNVFASVGSNVTLSVTSAGTPPLNYQWYENGIAMQGANLNYITISPASNSDAGIYQVNITNLFGQAASSNINLSVGTPVTITNQSVSLTVTQGQNATFSILASGSLPLHYQWTRNGSAIANATSSSYTFIDALASDNGNTFAVIATNFYSSVTSSNSTLTVLAPVTILEQPVGQTVSVGGSITFSVLANAGGSQIYYQWFNTNNILTNETSSSLELTNLQLTDSGGYFVVVSNSFGSVTSSIALLNLIAYQPNRPYQPYPSSGESNLLQGLVAYYPFNGNANDNSGNGNNGTTNQINFVPNQFDVQNDAIQFSGGSSAVTISNSTTLNLYQSLTLSGWIFTTNPNANDSGLVSRDGDTVSDTQWMARLKASGQYSFWHGNGSSFSEFLSNGSYQEGTWQAFLMSFNETNGLVSLYINGSLDTNYTTSLTTFSNISIPLVIGNQVDNTHAFIGCLDDVRIYNRVLSSNEVAQLFNYENGSLIPQSLSFNFGPNNAFQLQFWGTPNFPYILQTATNLTPPIIWQSVCTNVSDPFGNWISTDTNTTAYPSKFYRASVPQTNN